MARWDEAYVASLRQEWGADAAANLEFSVAFGDRHPEIRDLLDKVAMGDHPVIVKIAAMLGRRYATVSGDPTSIGKGRTMSMTDHQDQDAFEDSVAELRAKQQEAHARGDYARANRFAEKERALYVKRHGDEPVVGRGGRNA